MVYDTGDAAAHKTRHLENTMAEWKVNWFTLKFSIDTSRCKKTMFYLSNAPLCRPNLQCRHITHTETLGSNWVS